MVRPSVIIKRTGGRVTPTPDQNERNIDIYKLRKRGWTIEAIQKHYGYKSSYPVQAAIERGKKLALERGINVEEVRISINEMYEDALNSLAADIREQREIGQVEVVYDGDGNVVQRRVRRGVSPRTAGELARSLTRWAEFCGLLEARSSEGGSNVSIVQLNMPSDGASFQDKWQNVDENAAIDAIAERIDEGTAIQPSDSSSIQADDSIAPEASDSTPIQQPEPEPIQVTAVEVKPDPKLTASPRRSSGLRRRRRA